VECVLACEAAVDNESSLGCEFHVVPPAVAETGAQCFAAVVANTWDTPISISVTRGNQSFATDQIARRLEVVGGAPTYVPLTNGRLDPGEVALVFLAGRYCPAPGTGIYGAAMFETGYGTTFRVVTSAPVMAYDIYPYAGAIYAASSATLLLPTSTWTGGYVAVDAFRKSRRSSGQPTTAIVAEHDDTHVTMRAPVAIEGGGEVAPTPAGDIATFTLARGQYVQFVQDEELTGAAIQSDKPIGVWGGATCLSIDVAEAACDGAHQQIPPIAALGHRYVAARYRSRYPGVVEDVPWRFVGAVDDTVLTYSPSTPDGAPTTLDAGQLVELWAAQDFTVASQDADHPFYMSAHMTGCEHVMPLSLYPDCRGDPEFINVIPVAQYLDRYTFFTDPTFPETNLVFVRQRWEGSFVDVSLDCLGTISNWQTIDEDTQFAHVDLVKGNFESVGGCTNGLHHASSSRPFGLTVWGWGNASTPMRTTTNSYAYPAGASVRPINTVIPPIL